MVVKPAFISRRVPIVVTVQAVWRQQQMKGVCRQRMNDQIVIHGLPRAGSIMCTLVI